ncbi:MAG: hypothetical protein ACD_29C00141G0005 [uncultured bacterium]|nr:MAG: hypothetical protein ACD_29C00141G0005 [uncultured bacterium]
MQVLLSHLEKYDGLKEALQDVLVCPPTDYTASQWEAIQSLMQLLPILVAELSLLFREKEQIDFVELNMTALKALGSSESPTDLALYLDYQMRHLLIDEFQDTSVMHLQLLEKIITGWEQNDGRTIFIVGDPMQSIYRFRNAEVGLFLRVQQNGLGPIHLNTLTLTTNFRSGKNMVDWFNNAFDIVFPKSADISSGRIPYKKSHAANEKIMGNGCEFFPIFDDEKNEAELLTAKIEMCLKNNPIDSVAILVRARSHLIPITQSLREKNIPFHAVEIESLSENIAIRDCVSLTRALLHRADKIAWLAILRSPLCGCPLSDLLTISNYAFNKNIYEAILDVEKIQTLSQDAMWRLSHLKNKLKQFFDEKKLISFSQRVENIWIALGGPATLASEHEIEYVKNYFILLQNLSEQSDEINLDSLVESLDGLYAAPIVSQNARVQMMTIHKSKGLEFDHVFIPGLHRQATRDTEKLFRWLEQPGLIDNIHLILAPIKAANEKEDLIYQYLKYCENKKLDYEMTRLLYVAITRAKKSCSLFAMINQLPKKDSFLEKLWPVLESQLAKLNRHDDLKSCDQIITSHHVMINRLTTDWQPPSFVKNISEMTVESQKIQINIDLDIQKHKIIGTLLHEILEEISKSDLMHWKNMNHFPSAKWRSRLFALGLLPNQIEKSLNLIQTAIQKTLSDERGLWILKKHFHAKSEWALSFNQQGSVTQYVLDRSFIENNIRWIIDYKISAPKDNENLLDFLNQQKSIYETQLNQYAYILSHHESHEIKCALYFPLCQGWIAWNYVLNSSNTINISAAHQSPPI